MSEEITEQETLYILRKCWVMTTNHCLDEENIKLKKAIKKVMQINKHRNNRNKQLREDKKKLKIKLEKKDKIIDELISSMAENHCSIKDIVREDICDDKCIGNNNWSCYECIKQYFERRIEDGNIYK